MILIVNTTSDTSLTEELKKHTISKEIDVVEAGSMNIGHCIGCNYCWLKTPGECSVKDDYEIILKKAIHADELWVISDTALGFIDHKGKNIYDRMLPIATMYLKFKGKQMRHVLRYKKKTDFGLIITGEADKEYLERWLKRAALNLGSKSLGVYEKEELTEAIACMQ